MIKAIVPIVITLSLSSGNLLHAADDPSALQVFNARSTAKPEDTIRKLRALHEKQPNDWRTRYYLATVLIQNEATENYLQDAQKLLVGAEQVKDPYWIAPWALLRKYQIQAKELEKLQSESIALAPVLRFEAGKDAEIRPMFAGTLARIDSALDPIREGTTTGKSELSADEVREDLYALKNLVASRWAYVQEKQQQTGRSLEEILAASLSEIKPRMSQREAGEILRRFVSSLSDGHCVVRIPDVSYPSALPIQIVDTPQGLVVRETQSGSPFKVGDLLLEVDGINANQALLDSAQLTVGSSAEGRRWNAVRELPTRWGENRTYAVLIEREGKPLRIDAKPVPIEKLPWLNLSNILSSEHWLDSRMLSSRIGYLRVSTWAPTDKNSSFSNSGAYVEKFCYQLDAIIKKLQKANDLVLDLRGNGGGSDALCTWLASYFVPDPMQIYTLRYRQTDSPITGDGFQNPERKAATYSRQPGPLLSTRLWVLTDSGCFSATDTLLNILTRNIPNRVKIIGRSPSGGIGGPQAVGTLRNTRAGVTVSTCKAFSVTGELLEGNPVKVDVPVQWTRENILAGRDPDLETALEWISKKK